MSDLLKRLMNQHRYMAPADDGGSGGGGSDHEDDENDDDENDDDSSQGQPQEGPEPGEQADGSMIIDLEDEEEDGGKGDKTQKNATDDQSDEDKEREAIREARRKERADKKNRQREREDSLRRELAAEREARRQLESRFAAFEGKDHSRELASLDEQIRRTAQQYNANKQLLSTAHEQHDGAAAAEATEKMIAAREQFDKLTRTKTAMEQSQRQNGNPALDSRMVANANKFMTEHSWYKPGSNDRDTHFVRVIDDELAAEGWDPKTDAYWNELRTRVKKFLPHRFAGGKVPATERAQGQQGQQRKNVVAGASEGSATQSKNTYHLSADRVAALKEAGMWSDPKKRAEAIKRFREYDKQNSKG